jgi:plastocyanin
VMRRALIFVLAVLMLAACSKQAPEITAQEQVPADQRTEAAGEGGDGGEGEGAGGGATFVAVDIAFDSAPDSLPAGETEITLVNEGAALHNVTIDGTVIVEAQGGQTQTGTVTLDPGVHEYICNVPGHEALMNGELTVE